MAHKIKDGKVAAVVTGSKRDKVYTIRKQEVGCWTCDCMAYRFSKGPVGYKRPCKHIVLAVHNHNAPVENLMVVNNDLF